MAEIYRSLFPYTLVPIRMVKQPLTACQKFDQAWLGAAWDDLTDDLVRIFVVFFALFAVASRASAEDNKTVQAGDAVVIATSDKSIVDKSGPLNGRVSIIESPTDPKTYTLVYLAPKTTADFTDAVKYSDGTDRTVLVSVTANNPPTLTRNDIYAQSFKALFVLFIIATILESGLAVIFNWRPFIRVFNAKGVKTVMSVLFAWFFVSVFGLDVITRLVNVYTEKEYPISFPGTIITALVVAGGSSVVNNLLIALGFRSIRTPEEITPKLRRDEAWISVGLKRKDAKGCVDVLIGPESASSELPIVGMITGSSNENVLRRFFLRDYGRFPPSGGYSVTTKDKGKYVVKLQGRDSNGKPLSETPQWGPYPLADGAIVDIELEL